MGKIDDFAFDEKFAVNDNNGEYGRQLEWRIFKFVIAVINYLKGIGNSPINNVLINQLSKSATSIGASYFQKSKINDNTVLLDLIDESQQIRNTLGSIVGKVRKSLNR